MQAFTLAVGLLAACNAPSPARDRDASTRTRPHTAAPAKTHDAGAPVPVKGKGTLRGRVLFHGKAPPPAQVVIKGADAAKCQAARAYYAREVVTSADGGLSEVLVAIQGLRKPDGWPPHEVDVEIGDCAFRPRVIHATAGDTLWLENHDSILVLPMIPDRSTPLQAAILPGQRHPRDVPRAGGFRMTDSLGMHDWMYAHVLVLPHPYHVVTSEEGRFEFADIPEGAYRLNLWHPKLGEKGEPFTIRAGETTTMEILYEPPAPRAPAKAPGKAPPGPD